MSFLVGVTGLHIAPQSANLGDPNASHFGTRLRSSRQENSPPDCFPLCRDLLKVRALPYLNTKKTSFRMSFLVGVTGLEPAA